jgi:putative endonuclease
MNGGMAMDGAVARASRGAMAYHGGLAAEGAVERHYARAGHAITARRWRGSGGEIDLIARDAAGLVFVEVKKSRTFARAAERVTARQMARIYASASEFLAGEPDGQDSALRFDVALVDQAGRIEIIENAFGH